MNPYDVLELEEDAKSADIKKAYRRLSGKHHPDKGGDPEEFRKIKLAFDVLSNPERRKRFHDTGRVDESPITPERIRIYLDQTLKLVIDAQRPDGTTDDPSWDNIRDKVILSIHGARIEINRQSKEAKRKLDRIDQLLRRFKSKTDADPIGEVLRDHRKTYKEELDKFGDALELSVEAERIFNTYDYEVGPGPEGQHSPSPTLRLSRAGPISFTR